MQQRPRPPPPAPVLKEEEPKSVLVVEQFDSQTVFDSRDARPPLFCIAAFKGDIEEARSLEINKDIPFDINTRTYDSFTPLHIAAYQGNVDFIRYLLGKSELKHNVKDATGNTALMLAVQEGQKEAAQILLNDSYTNVNETNYRGRTALALAAIHSDFDEDGLAIFRDCLNCDRIDINQKCCDQGNVIQLLQSRGWPQRIIREIGFHRPEAIVGNIHEELWDAGRHGKVQKLKYLLYKENVDVNLFDRNNNSTLILACIYGRTDAVSFLLGIPHIEINTRNRFGNTALTMATYKGFSEVVRLLLQAKDIDPNIQNSEGDNTALHLAIRENAVTIAKLIIRCNKTDLDVRNEEGETAYEQAKRLCRTQITDYIEKSPNVTFASEKDDFLEACIDGHEERVYSMLEDRRVNPNVKDSDGCSALSLAVQYKQYAVVLHLLSCQNINLKARNRRGETALTIAQRANDTRALQMLQEYSASKRKNSASQCSLICNKDFRSISASLHRNGLKNVPIAESFSQEANETNEQTLVELAGKALQSTATVLLYDSEDLLNNANNCVAILQVYRYHIPVQLISCSITTKWNTNEGRAKQEIYQIDLEVLDTLAMLGITERQVRSAFYYCTKDGALFLDPSASAPVQKSQVNLIKEALKRKLNSSVGATRST